jgi:hypothetical protein
LTVLAAGPIVNAGSLRADGAGPGAFGSGGGAGGVVVLASKQRVTNRGVIHAHGGAGGQNGNSDGPGGGGGGGIVHLLAANTVRLANLRGSSRAVWRRRDTGS